MKKWILLTMVSVLPMTMMAQDDDMYFVPTKENVAKEVKNWGMPKDTYYSGSNRSVDDYNQRKVYSSDSTGNDIINFSAVRGVYPDSIYMDSSASSDYQYTKQLSRFDDYSPSDIYWEGYRDGRWSSPWYYNSAYYPWYDAWYDPWYTPYYNWRYHYYGWGWGWNWGWYGGYYDPWYYHYRPVYYSGRNNSQSILRGTYRGGGSGSNSSWGRAQRRSTSPSHRYDNSSRGNRPSGYNNSGSSFGGGSSRSGGGSFSGGGGGGHRSSGGHSFGTRR